MVRFDPFYNGWLKTFPSRDTAWESKIFTKPDVVFDNPFETAINQLGSELPFFVSTLQWGLKKWRASISNLRLSKLQIVLRL